MERDKGYSIPETALVLDIGGGLRPNPRADFVVDICHLESVRPYGNRDLVARFSPDNWIVHDICSSEPFPFPDKFFDFAFCTHVLEDVRDPLRVCEEMTRVAKAGYIEVPSMESELTVSLESRHYVGRWHHRWLVEVKDRELIFRMKPHFVNGYWKARIPRAWWTTDPAQDVAGFFWAETFSFREEYYQYRELEDFVEEFVRSRSCYSPARYYLWDRLKTIKAAVASLPGVRPR